MTKRLRVFAGPNGSGKSTLVKHVTEQFNLHYGFFVNADEIEKCLRKDGFFDFSTSGADGTNADFEAFIQTSSLFKMAPLPAWNISGGRFYIVKDEVNSYHAALIAEFIRQRLLHQGVTFSTETVMSAPQKLDMFRQAKQMGYRLYLYFVATESPLINQVRVLNRVKLGGHNVPVDKIVNRYFRSLELLYDAIKLSDRAFLFDNTESLRWIAEVHNGHELLLHMEDVPNWFVEYIEQKIIERKSG